MTRQWNTSINRVPCNALLKTRALWVRHEDLLTAERLVTMISHRFQAGQDDEVV